jgi:hypothetical protein
MIAYTNPFFREKPRDRKTYIIECTECVDTLDILAALFSQMKIPFYIQNGYEWSWVADLWFSELPPTPHNVVFVFRNAQRIIEADKPEIREAFLQTVRFVVENAHKSKPFPHYYKVIIE